MKKLFVSVLFMFSIDSLASDWLPTNKIDNIRVDQYGNLYGNTTEQMPKEGCNTTAFMIPKNQEGYEIMVSFLLSATAAGRDIQLKSAQCQSEYSILVQGVRFNKP